MGNKVESKGKCRQHTNEALTLFCNTCHQFLCPRCDDRHHEDLTSMEETLALWRAELQSSLASIHNFSFAVNNVKESLLGLQRVLNYNYEGANLPSYTRLFELMARYIKGHAAQLAYGVEGLLAHSHAMQKRLDKPADQIHKLPDEWVFWKQAEERAEIEQDIQAYMYKLQELQSGIDSKEEVKLLPAMHKSQLWMMARNYALMHKYENYCCGVEDQQKNGIITLMLFMPSIPAIVQYSCLPPQVAYAPQVDMSGTLYLCGGSELSGPANTLFAVTVKTDHVPTLARKASLPRSLYQTIVAKVHNQYILVLNYETRPIISELYCYSISNDQWTTLPPLTSAHWSGSLFISDDAILYVRDSRQCLFALDLLDTEAGWEQARIVVDTINTQQKGYVTAKTGVRFGKLGDAEYGIAEPRGIRSRRLIRGRIYSALMETSGKLSYYNTLTRTSQSTTYRLI